jgi:uncharacterized protein YpmB
MDGKKGVVEVQFNWIFILIAGALILIFFVTVVQKQDKASTQNQNVDIRSKLNTVIKIPSADLTFGCNGYSVGGTSPFQLGESFSPGRIKSAENVLLLKAEEWGLPYKITNFQYITTPDVKYVLIGSGAEIRAMAALLPENTTKVSVETSANSVDFNSVDGLAENANNYKIRFVTIGRDPTGFILTDYMKKMADEDVTALQIEPEGEPTGTMLDGYGLVTFYGKKKSEANMLKALGPSAFYLKEETVRGAMLVDSLESYNCIMARAWQQFGRTSEVYRAKADNLYELYKISTNPDQQGPFAGRCGTPLDYRSISDKISDMEQKAAGPMSLNSVEAIYRDAYGDAGIKDLNAELLDQSCPLVY